MKKRAWGFGLMALLAAAGCGGEVVGKETTSEAAIVNQNGIKINGVKVNGIKINGTVKNGIKINGIKINGIKINGTALSTVTSSATGDAISGVYVDKTTLRGTRSNGTAVSGTGFANSTLVGQLSDGDTVMLGISAVNTTSDAEILNYTLKIWDEAVSGWVDACEGGKKAIPVAGKWLDDGSKVTSTTEFTFACLDQGAVAKCVQMGYKPWSYDSHHRSCVRMVTGDYCGTGVMYTQDGNYINVFDKIGKQADDHNSQPNYIWYFDAEWGPNGAVCITSLATRPSNGQGGIACITQRFGNGGFCYNSTTNFQSGVYVKNYWGTKLF